jgi:hypothetical protein
MCMICISVESATAVVVGLTGWRYYRHHAVKTIRAIIANIRYFSLRNKGIL